MSLFAEYNKRSGSDYTPSKKVVNCTSSQTNIVFGDYSDDPAPVRKTKVPTTIAHVAADNVKFEESSEIESVRPSKVQAPDDKTVSKIEFGASENEVVTVKKVQVSGELAHVAGTKVAFGDRNVPTDADKFKASKGPVLNSEIADSSIEFGKAAEVAPPASPSKTALQITFEETEQNMVPVASAAKPAKAMNATPVKGAMADVLLFPEEQLGGRLAQSRRVPAGGNSSITFGDAFTPAKPASKTSTSDMFNVMSPTPVEVKHKSNSFQSSAFTALPNGEQPPQTKPSKKQVFSEVVDVEEKFGKMKTDQSDKKCEIFSEVTEEVRPRCAKKSIHQQPTSVFSFGQDTAEPVTGLDRLQPTVPSSKGRLSPTVSHAAGSKPKPLEPTLKTRGPVGGTTSVIFG